jgi:DNA-binding winged helix-turn-helix (wHTH) protein/tetratricopeptide (TPR) repeat protein
VISLSPGKTLTLKKLPPKIIAMTERIAFGPYELDAEGLELRRDGRLIRLAPQACRLLVALTASPAAVVTRDELQRALWSDSTHVGFERSLNSAMRKLRVALNEDAASPRYVQTIQGRGYRFIAPVQPAGGVKDVDRPVKRNDRRWRVRAFAAAVGIAVVCVAVVYRTPASSPLRVIVWAEDGSHADLVSALRVHIGRLAPSKLVVVDRTSRATHELVVTARAIRLIDRRRDEQVWADFVDTAGTADRAALIAVGRATADRLLPGDVDAQLAASTTEARALAAYRDGRAIGGERVSALTRAIDSFETAATLDHDFAPAWAALARARATRALLDGRDSVELERARVEAQRALAVDRALVDAHVALGQVRLAADDPAGAVIDFQRADALGTDGARHQLWLVWALSADGRHTEALRVIDAGLARDPRDATLHAWRGFLLHAVRRYDDEIVELVEAVSMDRDSWQAALHLGLGYSRRREYALALPALRRAVTLSDGGGIALSWLGRIAADAGDVGTATEALQQLRAAGRTRGLAPSLAASIEYHLSARGGA